MAQQRWQDCELGIIYHFDLPVAAGRFAPSNAVKERLDPALYNPEQLDTDQWIEAAKAMGARYAIFTATHFNGFLQWQSDLYPYGVRQAKWRNGRGDVVADFVNSCREADILPGIYFSTFRNAFQKVWGHCVDWGRGHGTAAQERFNRLAENMSEELCSRYGDLVQIWYDSGVRSPSEGGPDVLPIFERHQPDSVFYHNPQRSDIRWIGNENGHAGVPCWSTMPGDSPLSHVAESWKPLLLNGTPEGTVWSPAMVDVPLRGANGVHNWFWNPDQDHAIEPTNRLMDIFGQSVGRNCNFVLGEVITPEGLVPEADIKRLRAFGRAVRERFSNPLASASGEGWTFHLPLKQSGKVADVVLMEEIHLGERVRAYELEGRKPGGDWNRLAAGQSIGHKRIHRLDNPELTALRVRAIKAAAPPVFRSIEVFGLPD
jgi:alpha-L-fucosidase